MSTLPFTTRGAPVIVYLCSLSTVATSHTTLPVAASSATNRPSSVPTKILPFHAATPRLATSQHAFTPAVPGTFGSYAQISLPVAASSANTLLHALDTYITPSITSGVDSC